MYANHIVGHKFKISVKLGSPCFCTTTPYVRTLNASDIQSSNGVGFCSCSNAVRLHLLPTKTHWLVLDPILDCTTPKDAPKF